MVSFLGLLHTEIEQGNFSGRYVKEKRCLMLQRKK